MRVSFPETPAFYPLLARLATLRLVGVGVLYPLSRFFLLLPPFLLVAFPFFLYLVPPLTLILTRLAVLSPNRLDACAHLDHPLSG